MTLTPQTAHGSPDVDQLLPSYRTTQAGRFIHVNQQLLDLLNYTSVEELLPVDVAHIWVKPELRRNWLDAIHSSGRVDMEVQYYTKNRTKVWVREIATLSHSGIAADSLATAQIVGCLVPIDDDMAQRQYLTYLHRTIDRMIDQAQVGLLKLDCNLRLIYANQSLLRKFPTLHPLVLSKAPVSSLVAHDQNSAVRLDFALEEALANGTSTIVAVTMQPRATDIRVPVSLQFFHISTDQRIVTSDASYFCRVQDLRLDPQVESFIRECGPRHPAFDELGVKTIIKKVRPPAYGGGASSEARQLEFEWANDAFLREVDMTLSQLRGKTDKELFGRHYPEYHERDMWVLENRQMLQTIEPHPTNQKSGQEYVFVVKTTVEPFDRVFVFYWTFLAGEFQRVCARMSTLSGSILASVLESLPFPVFARDASERFVYSNPAFCRHISRRLSDVSGLTDAELNRDHPSLAGDYLAVDRRVREMADQRRRSKSVEFDCSITMEEENVDSSGEHHNVIVTKTSMPSTGGIVGVFWRTRDIDSRLDRGLIELQSVPLKAHAGRRCDVFVSYAKEDRRWLRGDDVAVNRGECHELLAMLNTFPGARHVFRPWDDSQISESVRRDVASAVSSCRVAIVLVSSRYLDPSGYAFRVELSGLLRRRQPGATSPVHILVVRVGPLPDRNLAVSDESQQSRDQLEDCEDVSRIHAGNRVVAELNDAERDYLWKRVVERVIECLRTTGTSV